VCKNERVHLSATFPLNQFVLLSICQSLYVCLSVCLLVCLSHLVSSFCEVCLVRSSIDHPPPPDLRCFVAVMFQLQDEIQQIAGCSLCDPLGGLHADV